MSKELVEIIEKLVSENPDIEQINARWDSRSCEGEIWVYIPRTMSSQEDSEFQNHYTDYVNETYGKDQDESLTLVCPTKVPVTEQAYSLVYDKKRGVIGDAI